MVDHNQLKHYWTKDPEGLAKWADHPHPWTALYHHLVKHMPPEMAKRVASQWFHDVFGIWPGEREGKNPLGPRGAPMTELDRRAQLVDDEHDADLQQLLVGLDDEDIAELAALAEAMHAEEGT